MGENDVGRERDQFRRLSANIGGIGRRPAGVDPHVAADGPAQLRQRLLERPDAGLIFRIVRGCGQEHADATHALGLLRTRGERRCSCSATKSTEKFSPPHTRPRAQDEAS